MKDKIAGGSFAVLEGTGCVASPSQLRVQASFSALPTLNLNTQQYEGAIGKMRFNVERTSPTGKTAKYQSSTDCLSASGINWNLKTFVPGDSGGSIDVANGSTGTMKSKKYNPISL